MTYANVTGAANQAHKIALQNHALILWINRDLSCTEGSGPEVLCNVQQP